MAIRVDADVVTKVKPDLSAFVQATVDEITEGTTTVDDFDARMLLEKFWIIPK